MAATQTVEFAPEYSKAERIRFVVLGAVAGALLISVSQLWFFPWLREISAAAPCRSVLGIKGTALLLYGVMVGVPLFGGLLVVALVGRRGCRILRDGQVPPIGEKVFRPTPIRRGRRARLVGWAHLLTAVPFFALAIWGGLEARSFAERADRVPAKCAPDA